FRDALSLHSFPTRRSSDLSELIFPSEFSGNSRELGASGKLFFDVAKDKARPFSVSSETITALVKGTSFVFRADGSKENSFVALRSEEHTSELQSRENLVCR